jgi:predicted DNA-binding transcriptional regulator AlpA
LRQLRAIGGCTLHTAKTFQTYESVTQMDVNKQLAIVKTKPDEKISPAQKAALIALRNYDNLPDAANIRLPTLMALKGASAASIWRWTRKGILPAAQKTGGATSWNVGELRRHPQAHAVPKVATA